MNTITKDAMQWPALVTDMESVDGAGGRQIDVSSYNSVWCLYRRHGVPYSISIWDVHGVDTAVIPSTASISRTAEPTAPLTWPADESGAPVAPLGKLMIVICTRNRPAGLARVLESLGGQTDRDFDVLVVDNAPTSAPAEHVVRETQLPRCRYVVEPRPGLSRARNRALIGMDADVVAWLDDDETADPRWVEWIKKGFAHPSRPDAVCGLMLPAELNTEAQVRFEQNGGFNKGRDLTPVVLTAGTPTVRSPLYPLPGFGSGGNMALRVTALQDLGGFDPGLGAGTRTHGGEETQVLARLLLRGGTILHWPPAITWHTHRETMQQLDKQFYGYSAGLSAFYVSMLLKEPRSILEVAKLVPRGVSDLMSHRGRGRSGDLPDDFPASLLRAGRRGLLHGAGLYLHEVLATRQRRGSAALG
jgi:glycosyltransferase involved in cell wall biosynthesis